MAHRIAPVEVVAGVQSCQARAGRPDRLLLAAGQAPTDAGAGGASWLAGWGHSRALAARPRRLLEQRAVGTCYRTVYAAAVVVSTLEVVQARRPARRARLSPSLPEPGRARASSAAGQTTTEHPAALLQPRLARVHCISTARCSSRPGRAGSRRRRRASINVQCACPDASWPRQADPPAAKRAKRTDHAASHCIDRPALRMRLGREP